MFSYLAKDNSLNLARRAVIDDNIFAKRTYQTRKQCWDVLHSRYFSHRGDSEQIHPIIAIFRHRVSEKMKQAVLYYHYAISDLFSYEVTVGLAYDLCRRGLTNIAPRDVYEFLDSKVKLHPEINRWSSQTRLALVSHYLSALRDFGILRGKRIKKIHRPAIEEDLFLYLVTYLRDCGKSSRDILINDDFKLFLLSQPDVEAKLAEAHRNRRIRFQKSAYLVSLELPWRSLLEYVEKLG